jgi:hypothetical protein
MLSGLILVRKNLGSGEAGADVRKGGVDAGCK